MGLMALSKVKRRRLECCSWRFSLLDAPKIAVCHLKAVNSLYSEFDNVIASLLFRSCNCRCN